MEVRKLTQQAREQWTNASTVDYMFRIASCYNCNQWDADKLDRERGCDGYCPRWQKDTKFDCWCPLYDGFCNEHNLAYEEYFADKTKYYHLGLLLDELEEL